MPDNAVAVPGLKKALKRAARAAYRDSNDREIELLRDALDLAIGALGYEWPEVDEDE